MSDVGDVHNSVDIVADITEVFFQDVLHDVGAQVADVGEVVYSRSAGVHFNSAGGMGVKFVLCSCEGVV